MKLSTVIAALITALAFSAEATNATVCPPDAQEACVCDDRPPFMRDPITEASSARVAGLTQAQLESVLHNEPDASVRQAAAIAIGRARETSVPALVQAASDPSCKVASAAVTALSGSNSGIAIDALAHAAASARCRVREAAVVALGAQRSPVAAHALIAALNDTDSRVRSNAAAAVGSQRDTSAVLPLVSLLADSNKHVREGAVRSLGQLRDRRALPAILERTHDEDKHVRLAAADVLSQFSTVKR